MIKKVGKCCALFCYALADSRGHQAVLLAYQDPGSQDLVRRIKAIFFLATPHRGSDSARLFNHILQASTFLSSREYISDLSRDSPSSQAVSDKFSMIAEKFQLWSFYETLKTRVSSTTTILVVDRESAVLGRRQSAQLPGTINVPLTHIYRLQT